MTDVMSIDKARAGEIYTSSTQKIGDVQTALNDLDKLIMDLPAGAQWKGDAADKFMGVYEEMRTKITTEFPDVLTQLAENLNKNRENFVGADTAGAGA